MGPFDLEGFDEQSIDPRDLVMMAGHRQKGACREKPFRLPDYVEAGADIIRSR